MKVESISWDGMSLSAVIAIESGRVTCSIPRDTIHALPLYNDAVSWEIDRHKRDVVERVKQVCEGKIRAVCAGDEARVQITPADLASL